MRPLRSTYSWQGAVEEAEEWEVEARTRVDQVPSVEAAVAAEHPYDVPLVEVSGPTRTNVAYADWASGVMA